jgi:hypothetical protein
VMFFVDDFFHVDRIASRVAQVVSYFCLLVEEITLV